jgi:hypothetical protein
MVAARADLAVAALPETASPETLALAMAKALARRAVIDWEGVGDAAGDPLPLSPEGVDGLLDVWPAFEAFQTGYVAKGLVLEAEKNASAPSPIGTSAEATPIAPRVRKPARTPRRG